MMIYHSKPMTWIEEHFAKEYPEINSKPSKTTVEPQKEQVNVIYQPTETNAHTLPNTGSESTLILSFAGMFILGGIARIALKREE